MRPFCCPVRKQSFQYLPNHSRLPRFPGTNHARMSAMGRSWRTASPAPRAVPSEGGRWDHEQRHPGKRPFFLSALPISVSGNAGMEG
jgi:hypothetical protein